MIKIQSYPGNLKKQTIKKELTWAPTNGSIAQPKTKLEMEKGEIFEKIVTDWLIGFKFA